MKKLITGQSEVNFLCKNTTPFLKKKKVVSFNLADMLQMIIHLTSEIFESLLNMVQNNLLEESFKNFIVIKNFSS